MRLKFRSTLLCLSVILLIGCSFEKKGSEGQTVKEYYDDGTPKLVSEVSNGQKNGTFIKYYDNGQVHFKTSYKNDKLDGQYIEYYRNGNVKSKVFYRKGLRQGEEIDYYENGEVSGYRFLENDSATYLKKFKNDGELDWYKIGVRSVLSTEQGGKEFWFKLPYSNLKDNLILGMVTEVRNGYKDTLYIKVDEGLDISIDVPNEITSSYDSLVFEIGELSRDSIPGIMGIVPLESVTYDTGIYYTTIKVK